MISQLGLRETGSSPSLRPYFRYDSIDKDIDIEFLPEPSASLATDHRLHIVTIYGNTGDCVTLAISVQ